MLYLFVLDAKSGDRVPVSVRPATDADLASTKSWQTDWTSPEAAQMPNKVALCRAENGELLGLMSYEVDQDALAVELIYMESAGHSNANLLHISGNQKSIWA